ncbi:SIS domain-containing protein [Paludibacterium yongneupense]|uniref:SIS domain-containing protein n=1 Tax=Paludibacterium yongneupense TaxID=400061 RepID=UPI00040C050B|nr:SIS domain-containing protein [Paludibacterium yongneupense]
MAADFNPSAFIESLRTSSAALDAAAAYGQLIAGKIDRIYFVSCGAPNRIMLGLQYWLERLSPSLEVRRYFPAEFMDIDPPRLDERTLVVFASKSGTTRETVDAARFVAARPCRTVCVTQTADVPLAQHPQQAFYMGKIDDAYFGCYMILQAIIGGVLAARDHWPHLDALLSSLRALPAALADTALRYQLRGAQEAEQYQNDKILYLLAAGPMFTSAYVVGVCILAESQWMHCLAIEAAEFFHGPFEAVDETTPLVLFLGEDPSRPQMERVLRFCQTRARRLMVYDSRDMPMPGISEEVRPMLAPYIAGFAFERTAAHLAERHNQALTTRRYMWKTEY